MEGMFGLDDATALLLLLLNTFDGVFFSDEFSSLFKSLKVHSSSLDFSDILSNLIMAL